MRWTNLQVFLLILLSFKQIIGHRLKKAKSVTTLLEAKWEATPLVLEVLEYLGDENTDYYWNYVDMIANLDPALVEIDSDKKRYDLLMESASKLLTSQQLSVLKLGLSLHIYSPKVQMFRQIAIERKLPNCKIVADVGGTLTCDIQKMKRLIDTYDDRDRSKIEIFNADTHYPGSENRTKLVVLYGELGTKEFTKFHNTLKNLAQDGSIDYVLRHYLQTVKDRKLRLSGYGVELQMKSTEYKVQDDTQVQSEGESDEASPEDEDVEIEGFDFKKLKSLFPDHKKDFDNFKQHLEESSNEMAPLKVWQFQELSLQAAERIMNAPKEESLKVFTNIAQNFPMQAKGLVKTIVNSELKKEMKRNQEIFQTTLNLQPSDN